MNWCAHGGTGGGGRQWWGVLGEGVHTAAAPEGGSRLCRLIELMQLLQQCTRHKHTTHVHARVEVISRAYCLQAGKGSRQRQQALAMVPGSDINPQHIAAVNWCMRARGGGGGGSVVGVCLQKGDAQQLLTQMDLACTV